MIVTPYAAERLANSRKLIGKRLSAVAIKKAPFPKAAFRYSLGSAEQHLEGENMPLLHIVIIAVIQGITEFLPISSSGHLILFPNLTGFEDKGYALDVAVHVGSQIGRAHV